MRYPNLSEFVKYHPYHQSTFANFANVTPDLMEVVLNGQEELTGTEMLNIARYTGIQYSILVCPKLIMLDRKRWKHWQMMKDLHNKLYEIWEYQKKGSKEAEWYMKYGRTDYVNMDLNFRNGVSVPYFKYLGIKERMNQVLSFAENEQHRLHNKPRGLSTIETQVRK